MNAYNMNYTFASVWEKMRARGERQTEKGGGGGGGRERAGKLMLIQTVFTYVF